MEMGCINLGIRILGKINERLEWLDIVIMGMFFRYRVNVKIGICFLGRVVRKKGVCLILLILLKIVSLLKIVNIIHKENNRNSNNNSINKIMINILLCFGVLRND